MGITSPGAALAALRELALSTFTEEHRRRVALLLGPTYPAAPAR